LGEDQDVDHANGSRVDQREQRFGHLAGEVARSSRKLDDDVVDGAKLVQIGVLNGGLRCQVRHQALLLVL